MDRNVVCPTCGTRDLRVQNYDAMMVLRSDLALFTLRCPRCGSTISTLHPIPDDLQDEIRFAAMEIGAGMGAE